MSGNFCFAKAVESMMEFRRSVGLSVLATKSMSSMFAVGWLEWESNQGRRGLQQKATFLRLLARFVNATGGLAYELPVACTPKPTGFSPHIFTDDELSMLFREIDSYEDAGRIVPRGTYPVMFRTIYTCGLRPGEGRHILLSDVDLSSGRILIRAAKRHKERLVVASDDMRLLLARFVGVRGSSISPLLFPRTDGRIIDRGLTRRVLQMLGAGVPEGRGGESGAGSRLRPPPQVCLRRATALAGDGPKHPGHGSQASLLHGA